MVNHHLTRIDRATGRKRDPNNPFEEYKHDDPYRCLLCGRVFENPFDAMLDKGGCNRADI